MISRSDRPRRVAWWRWPLIVVLYGLLLTWAVSTVDLGRALHALGALSPIHIAIVIGLAGAHIAGRASRYHQLVLVAEPNRTYHFYHGLRVFLAGLCTAIITPARIGDLVKARMLQRFGVGVAPAANLVIIERILDLASVVAILLVAVPFLPTGQGDTWIGVGLVGAGGFAIGVFGIANSWARTRLESIATLLVQCLPLGRHVERAVNLVGVVFHGLAAVFASPRRAVALFAWSVAAWGVEFAKLWLVLWFLGGEVSLAVVLFAYPASIIASLLVLLPISEGVVSVTAASLLVAAGGVDPALAAGAIVIDRAASSLTPYPLWAAVSTWLRCRDDLTPVVSDGV